MPRDRLPEGDEVDRELAGLLFAATLEVYDTVAAMLGEEGEADLGLSAVDLVTELAQRRLGAGAPARRPKQH